MICICSTWSVKVWAESGMEKKITAVQNPGGTRGQQTTCDVIMDKSP